MDNKIKKLSPLTESTFYILLVLQNQNHGYGVIKQVEDLTKGRLKLAAGTLYGAIQNLLRYKLISLVNEDVSNKKKKEYLTTELGKSLLSYEIKRLKEMIKSAKVVI